MEMIPSLGWQAVSAAVRVPRIQSPARQRRPRMQRLPTSTTPHTAPRRGFVRSGSSGLRLALFGLALLAFGLAGCSANTGADMLLAARVNGSPITLSQYDSMLRFTQASSALRGQTGDLQ